MHLYPSTLQKDLLCVFQGPERKLLSESRWPRIPMVLHYRPKSTHNVLHQHPSVWHPKQACQWWEIQQLYLRLKSERKKLIFSKAEAGFLAASAFSYFVDHEVHMRPCNHSYWFVTTFTLSLWRTVAYRTVGRTDHHASLKRTLTAVQDRQVSLDSGRWSERINAGWDSFWGSKRFERKRIWSMVEYTNSNFPRQLRDISLRPWSCIGIRNPLWGCVVVYPWEFNMFL